MVEIVFIMAEIKCIVILTPQKHFLETYWFHFWFESAFTFAKNISFCCCCLLLKGTFPNTVYL